MLERREVNFSTRQILCPAYSICLDKAVEAGTTGFSCCDCARRYDKQPIPPDEPTRCGALIAEIFFREHVFPQKATCLRCRRTFTFWAGTGAGGRRFCKNCGIYIDLFLSDYDAGQRVELRGMRLPTVPMEDEPGFDGGETT